MEAVLEAARRAGSSWDLQIELGLPVWASVWNTPDFEGWFEDLAEVYSFGNANTSVRHQYLPFMVRGRVGYLSLREPWYFGLGVTASYDSLAKFAVGLQADITHTWGGVWGQAETAWSPDTGLVLSVAGGYQLLGVEFRTTHGGRDFAVMGKVRIPIGLVYYVRLIYDQSRERRLVKIEE